MVFNQERPTFRVLRSKSLQRHTWVGIHMAVNVHLSLHGQLSLSVPDSFRFSTLTPGYFCQISFALVVLQSGWSYSERRLEIQINKVLWFCMVITSKQTQEIRSQWFTLGNTIFNHPMKSWWSGLHQNFSWLPSNLHDQNRTFFWRELSHLYDQNRTRWFRYQMFYLKLSIFLVIHSQSSFFMGHLHIHCWSPLFSLFVLSSFYKVGYPSSERNWIVLNQEQPTFRVLNTNQTLIYGSASNTHKLAY